MLIEFRVANHRSLRDEQVLTMEAGRVGDEAAPRPRQVPGHSDKLLPAAGLYGANASGKSNVLAALAFMREAVLLSHRSWEPDGDVPRDPFAWGAKKAEPSLFEVKFLKENVQYQYGFIASDKCFLEEWLYAWPNGKKQIWFEREEKRFKFGENLKGENKLIVDITRPNALFLSSAVQHNHPMIDRVFPWFRRIRFINFSSGGRRRRFLTTGIPSEYMVARLFEDPSAAHSFLFTKEKTSELLLDRFLNILRMADVGIVDLRVDKNESKDTPPRTIYIRNTRTIYLRNNRENENARMPLKEESHGTRTLFDIEWPLLQVIQDGAVLVVDELERSLHPALARKIVQLFNDPATNPKNAQIIFTTHDTNLLGTTVGEPALRRDQVWLTEKDDEGATVLYPLTDYKPRKAENIERGYLQGRYGAIPFLGDLSLTEKTEKTE